jgi:type IV secretory pathway VirB6-like protein
MRIAKNASKPCKSKTIPVIDLQDLQGCKASRIAHFLDNRLTDGFEVVSSTCHPRFTPGRFLVLDSVRDRINPRTTVRLEVLGQLNKNMTFISETRNFQAFNIARLTTMLPRAHELIVEIVLNRIDPLIVIVIIIIVIIIIITCIIVIIVVVVVVVVVNGFTPFVVSW